MRFEIKLEAELEVEVKFNIKFRGLLLKENETKEK